MKSRILSVFCLTFAVCFLSCKEPTPKKIIYCLKGKISYANGCEGLALQDSLKNRVSLSANLFMSLDSTIKNINAEIMTDSTGNSYSICVEVSKELDSSAQWVIGKYVIACNRGYCPFDSIAECKGKIFTKLTPIKARSQETSFDLSLGCTCENP